MADETSPPGVDRRYKAFREAIDGAYWTGFEHGQETGERIMLDQLRAEITEELRHELERFDPDCALCVARRKIDELEKAIDDLRQDVDELKVQRRGWMIRRH